MELIGLEIETRNKKKFIGKVGIVPSCATVPSLKNHCIIYREAKGVDAISHTTNTFGFDYAVWLRAKELGAEGMVTYFTDFKQLALCSKETIDGCGFELSLGEGVQIRVPIKSVKIIQNAKPIVMGYTTICETVPPFSQEDFPTNSPDKQLNLF